MKLEEQTDKTVHQLEKFERNWHIFKSILFTTTAAVIIASVAFFANKAVRDAVKQNDVIYCVLLTNPDTRNHNTVEHCKYLVNVKHTYVPDNLRR